MANRMTICNMTIEGGGRAGMIAPDETTFEWVEGRPGAPADFDAALAQWRELPTDDGAVFDEEVAIDSASLSPMVTWGTNPGQVVEVTGAVPEPSSDSEERALRYMDLEPGRAIEEIELDRVFIGSCTNSRIEDLREAASMVEGRKVASSLSAMVVPGSAQVKAAAEAEGLDEVFRGRRVRLAQRRLLDVPGDEPRHADPGRALRLDLEPQLRGPPGQGRAHPPGRPKMAAAAAIEGRFVDIRTWES